MYPPQKDSPSTVTVGEITPSDTTVVVQSAAILPQEPPFPLTLGVDKGVTETVLVTAINGNELTIQRGYYGQTLTWIAGTKVARVLNAADIAALQENVTAVSQGVTDEQERAQQAEQGLAASIAAEETRATCREDELQGLVETEATRATGVEAALGQAIAAEKTRVEGVEATLGQAIAAEKSRAEGAESALGEGIQSLTSDLATETGARQAADAELLDAISTEADRAGGVEAALGHALAAEQSRAEGAESAIDGRLSSAEGGIAALGQAVSELPEAFIPQSQKGVPSGVATLNPQGIVPESQLPPLGGGEGSGGVLFSQNDNVTIRAGEFTNAGSGWQSFSFPGDMEFDGIPTIYAKLKEADGFVQIRNVTARGFEYQVRFPGVSYSAPSANTSSYYTADGADQASAHTARSLVTSISGGSTAYAGTTTASALVISWIAVYDDSY